MDRKMKLETLSEQLRLLSDIPKVIPEIVDAKPSPEGSPSKDNIEQNDMLELATAETCNSVGRNSKHSGFACHLNDTTDVAGLPGFPVCTPSLFFYTYSVLVTSAFIFCLKLSHNVGFLKLPLSSVL